MGKVVAGVLVSALLASAGVALAGDGPAQNDYEGKVEGEQETYVGFDLSKDKKTVKAVGAYFRYKCDNGKGGSLFTEIKKKIEVKDREFDGKIRGPSKGTMIYEISGKLKKQGKANGEIEATLKLSPGVTCTARDDGEWKAKKGRDVEIPSPIRRRSSLLAAA
jgi:hypothetical protein